MNKYRPRTLIDGFQVAPEYKGKEIIAVPKRKLSEEVNVYFGGDVMRISKGTEPLTEIEFPDKFNRGKYTLSYFEWKPDKQEQLF